MSKTEKQQKRRRDAPIRANTLTPSEKLSAICFAANEFGISYGKYRNILTVSEEEAVYVNFAERLERQRLHEIELSENQRKKSRTANQGAKSYSSRNEDRENEKKRGNPEDSRDDENGAKGC